MALDFTKKRKAQGTSAEAARPDVVVRAIDPKTSAKERAAADAALVQLEIKKSSPSESVEDRIRGLHDAGHRYLNHVARLRGENQRARAWREGLGWSRRELADRTGYSERAIAALEVGEYSADRPVEREAFKTYRLACAAVALGITFDWGPATLTVRDATITAGGAPNAANVGRVTRSVDGN